MPAMNASCDPTSSVHCVRVYCVCCVSGPCCCCDPDGCPPGAPAEDAPCATRDPSLLESAAISIPSESSPESFACGSALPDAHADEESSDWLDSRPICVAKNARCSRCCCHGARPRSHSHFARSAPLLRRSMGDGGGDGDDALWMG